MWSRGIGQWTGPAPSRDSREVSLTSVCESSNAEHDEAASFSEEDAERNVLRTSSSQGWLELSSKVSLDQTSYDAIVMVVVCVSDESYCQRHGPTITRMWLWTSILLHICVVAFQFAIVFCLLVTTAQTAADPFRHGIEEKTSTILQAAANQTHLRLDQSPIELCEQMDVLKGGHLLIQIVWAARMLQEFTESIWRAFYIFTLHQQHDNSISALQEEPDGDILILHTSPGLCCLFLLISSVPQCSCAVLLWWTGAKFLFFATSMGVLIMKAISLAFVTTLDEMMFKSWAPQGFKDLVGNCKYCIGSVRLPRHLYMWGACILKFVISVALAIFIYWGVFGYVTSFRMACWEYWKVFPADIPHRGSESLWTTFLKGLEIA